MRKLTTIGTVRFAIAAALAVSLSACANPWNAPPRGPVEAGLQKAVVASVSRRYGNYCGYGRRYAGFSAAPIDELDAACRAHDLCYHSGKDRCGCDEQLYRRSAGLSRDKRLSPKLRRNATLIAEAMSLQFCKIFPHGFLPPFKKPV